MATNFDLNQRIVHAGLLRMSNDRNIVKSAFSHWNESNTDAQLDIFDVVTDLVEFLGLDVSEKKGLMIGLHNASGQLYDDLKPVPPYILGNSDHSENIEERQVAENSEEKLPAHLAVTARYLQLISLNIKRDDVKTHQELVKAVSNEGLGGMTKTVSAWATEGLNLINFESNVSVQDCQDLAHEFYVLVCDFLGPVESDTIVNKVISELASFEASREFEPRKLL